MYHKSMNLAFCIVAFLLFQCRSAFSISDDSLFSTHEEIVNSKRNIRHLKAAQAESTIGRRSIHQALRCDHELHYVDDLLDRDDKRITAQVQLSTRFPTLTLEEIDHHLANIQCSPPSVLLGFVTISAKEAVFEQLRSHPSFYLVTSHATCNNDGERNVYLVSTVASTGVAGLDLTLSVSSVQWKHSVETIRIDFGKSERKYHVPQQGRIEKRQATSTSEAVVVVESTGAASTTADITFPVPAPTSTPTGTSTHEDLGFSYIDTPLLPPDFPGVDSTTLSAPFVPQGVSISCKNCTVTGTIDILQGSISGNASNSTTGEDDDFFSWDGGSFAFETNDFSAHIELEASVQPSVDLNSFEAPLPDIGIPGFFIPGIGAVGPIFRPRIFIGTQIGSNLTFTYGFNLTVPDNSSIILDLSDPEDSSIIGFPNTSISALPFQSAVSSISLTVSAAFRPELLLGISLLRSAVNLGAGVFFNLPTVSATVAQVFQVNSLCEPVGSNSSTTANVNVDNSTVFDDLTHIEPEVGIGFGVLAEGQAAIGARKPMGGEQVFTIFETNFPLPTACLGFDEGEGTLGPVVAAAATGTGVGAVPSGIASGAERGKENVLGGILGRMGRWERAVVMLIGVCVLFGGL